MAQLHEYRCPSCGGAIVFDSESQNMKCPYCSTELEVEALAAYDAILQESAEDDLHWEQPAGGQWAEGETETLRTYICNSCGGQVMGDATLAATSCPYCGNPVIMMNQFAGILKPDVVIPFKLDKEAAVAAVQKHYSTKRLLPKSFKNNNHIWQIKGIYVPVWLYDTDVDADIRYRATRTHTWSDSRYIYTRTKYYALLRSGQIGFDRVPVDGSSKMPDDLMESIEPYHFEDAVDFQTAYLAGFLADKYDVDAVQSQERANQRIRQSTEDNFRSTTGGYMTVVQESSSIRFRNGKARYALYPVWMLGTQWNGKIYTFAMNGQTGKLAGDLPLCVPSFFKWLLGLTALISAAAFGLCMLIPYL